MSKYNFLQNAVILAILFLLKRVHAKDTPNYYFCYYYYFNLIVEILSSCLLFWAVSFFKNRAFATKFQNVFQLQKFILYTKNSHIVLHTFFYRCQKFIHHIMYHFLKMFQIVMRFECVLLCMLRIINASCIDYPTKFGYHSKMMQVYFVH